jgi:hypothetical protein
MMPLPFPYCERYVAFIDILGFKDMVLHINANVAAFQVLLGLPAILERVAGENHAMFSDKPDFQCTAFSDSIVISTDASSVAQFVGIYSIIHAVLELAKTFMKANALVRGGISKGMLYHKGPILFGEGVVQAYELETNIARVPRVVVSPEVRLRWDEAFAGGRWIPVLKDVIRTDDDGMGFVDLFHFPRGDSIDNGTRDFIRTAGNTLAHLLDKPRLPLAAWTKVVWLANQYNRADIVRRLRTLGITLPDIEIPIEPRAD